MVVGNTQRPVLSWSAFLALPVLVLACASKPDRSVQRLVHAGSPPRAKRPAEVQSQVILPYIPGYPEYAASTQPPDDPALLILRAKVLAEYDRILLRVLNQKGFDLICEKGKSESDAPLPDLTFHVLREAILEFDRSSLRATRTRLLDEVIAREEQLWKLREEAHAHAGEMERLRVESISKAEEAARLRETLAARDASIRSMTEAKAALDAELARLRAERDSLKIALDGATQNAAALQQTIAHTEERLRRAESRANVLESELSKLRLERDQLGGRLSEKLEAAQRSLQELHKQVAERDAAIAAAAAETARLQAQREALEREVVERRKKLEDLEREAAGRIDRLGAEASRLAEMVAEIQDQLKRFGQAKPTPEEHADLLRKADKASVRARLLRSQVEADPAVPADLRDRVLQAAGALDGLRKQAADLQP